MNRFPVRMEPDRTKTMRKRLNDQRGVASLEFVLILPILLFVIFIGVELSRAWMTLNLLTSAAREAARAGVVAAPDAVAAAGNARLTQILAGTGGWFGPGTTCSQFVWRLPSTPLRRRPRASSTLMASATLAGTFTLTEPSGSIGA